MSSKTRVSKRNKKTSDAPRDPDLIERAAERAGVRDNEQHSKRMPLLTSDSPQRFTKEEIRDWFERDLVVASELVAEYLASYYPEDTGEGGDRILEINRCIWLMRWELGILPSDVAAKYGETP